MLALLPQQVVQLLLQGQALALQAAPLAAAAVVGAVAPGTQVHAVKAQGEASCGEVACRTPCTQGEGDPRSLAEVPRTRGVAHTQVAGRSHEGVRHTLGEGPRSQWGVGRSQEGPRLQAAARASRPALPAPPPAPLPPHLVLSQRAACWLRGLRERGCASPCCLLPC